MPKQTDSWLMNILYAVNGNGEDCRKGIEPESARSAILDHLIESAEGKKKSIDEKSPIDINRLVLSRNAVLQEQITEWKGMK